MLENLIAPKLDIVTNLALRCVGVITEYELKYLYHVINNCQLSSGQFSEVRADMKCSAQILGT